MIVKHVLIPLLGWLLMLFWKVLIVVVMIDATFHSRSWNFWFMKFSDSCYSISDSFSINLIELFFSLSIKTSHHLIFESVIWMIVKKCISVDRFSEDRCFKWLWVFYIECRGKNYLCYREKFLYSGITNVSPM